VVDAHIAADMAPPAARCMAVDAARGLRLSSVGGVYRSVLNQADTPIKDATRPKIMAGPAVSLGSVAESPADGDSATGNQRTERVSHA
jgi:hypothetical protein